MHIFWVYKEKIAFTDGLYTIINKMQCTSACDYEEFIKFMRMERSGFTDFII